MLRNQMTVKNKVSCISPLSTPAKIMQGCQTNHSRFAWKFHQMSIGRVESGILPGFDHKG